MRSRVFAANPARTCADPSIELRNQARFSRENRSRAARTLASTIAEKPSTEHGFLGKSGADLPGPKHVAQKRSTVLRGPEHLLAKFHRARFSLQTRRGPKHFAQEPARSTVFSAKPARSCTNPSISPKTWHGPRFPRQIGADLCGPEHLAKKPFPQSTVFSAKQARTCADPSLQTRNLPRTTVLSAKQARTCADPSLQTRNLPRTTVLSARQARTLLRAFGNYKGYNRNIPQLEQQAQHSVSLSCTKLSHCMGGRGGSNKVV